MIAAIDAAFDMRLADFPSAEAQPANLADDIAYLSHDFDDALRADLFTIKDIAELPQVGESLRTIASTYGELPVERLTHELIRRLISVFVGDLLAQSSANIDEINAVSPDDIRTAGRAIIGFSPRMAVDLETIREFLFSNMWRHYKVKRMTSKEKRVVTDLFYLFMSETNTLPTGWQQRTASRSPIWSRQAVRGSSLTHRVDDRPLCHAGTSTAFRARSDPEIKMNIFRFFEEELQQIIKNLQTAGVLAAGLDTSRVVFELRDDAHGDLACNARWCLPNRRG